MEPICADRQTDRQTDRKLKILTTILGLGIFSAWATESMIKTPTGIQMNFDQSHIVEIQEVNAKGSIISNNTKILNQGLHNIQLNQLPNTFYKFIIDGVDAHKYFSANNRFISLNKSSNKNLSLTTSSFTYDDLKKGISAEITTIGSNFNVDLNSNSSMTTTFNLSGYSFSPQVILDIYAIDSKNIQYLVASTAINFSECVATYSNSTKCAVYSPKNSKTNNNNWIFSIPTNTVPLGNTSLEILPAIRNQNTPTYGSPKLLTITNSNPNVTEFDHSSYTLTHSVNYDYNVGELTSEIYNDNSKWLSRRTLQIDSKTGSFRIAVPPIAPYTKWSASTIHNTGSTISESGTIEVSSKISLGQTIDNWFDQSSKYYDIPSQTITTADYKTWLMQLNQINQDVMEAQVLIGNFGNLYADNFNLNIFDNGISKPILSKNCKNILENWNSQNLNQSKTSPFEVINCSIYFKANALDHTYNVSIDPYSANDDISDNTSNLLLPKPMSTTSPYKISFNPYQKWNQENNSSKTLPAYFDGSIQDFYTQPTPNTTYETIVRKLIPTTTLNKRYVLKYDLMLSQDYSKEYLGNIQFYLTNQSEQVYNIPIAQTELQNPSGLNTVNAYTSWVKNKFYTFEHELSAQAAYLLASNSESKMNFKISSFTIPSGINLSMKNIRIEEIPVPVELTSTECAVPDFSSFSTTQFNLTTLTQNRILFGDKVKTLVKDNSSWSGRTAVYECKKLSEGDWCNDINYQPGAFYYSPGVEQTSVNGYIIYNDAWKLVGLCP